MPDQPISNTTYEPHTGMEWSVTSMDYLISYEVANTTYSNVVTEIYWSLSKTANGVTVDTTGQLGVLRPNSQSGNTFIEWSDIDSNTAVQWVKDGYGEEMVWNLEERLDRDLELLLNPVFGNGLPW